MENAAMFTIENFISTWNGDFPNYELSAADLKKPHSLVGALLQVFDRLGIHREVVLSESPEENINESMVYYRDLLPVINMTRVINHLVSVMPQVDGITVTHFLQPTATTSHSILLLLFNLMLFNEQRLSDIAPYEEELFAKTGQVKTLEDKKNKLLEMLNEQAEEKGKRTERLEKLNYEISQIEEETKQETEIHEKEKPDLDAILKENHKLDILLEQNKTQRDTLLSEVARKKALRVYDADDIKAQAEQSAQNVQEAEEKLTSLRAMLMQKENSLKNLLTIKPSLETANNLLHEITKLSDRLKDSECGDLDTDSKEGELDVLKTELSELQVQLRELQTTRAEVGHNRQASGATRQHERTVAQSALREAEEKDKKCRERCKKAEQRTEEIKKQTHRYEQEKSAGMEEIVTIKNKFFNELKTVEDTLAKKMIEMAKRVEERMRNRNI